MKTKEKKKPFERIQIEKAVWFAEGERLFGEDMLKWRFVCPSCGNIQSAEDFKKYVDQGAVPGDAYSICIGRYIPGSGHLGSKTQPCNYSGGGLFKLNPVEIIDGQTIYNVFDFDRSGVEI